MINDLSRNDQSVLVAILSVLAEREYSFVTPTAATHRRVIARRDGRPAEDLRDVFGWNLAFRPELPPPDLLDLLARADAVEVIGGGLLRARLRVSSCEGRLFLHSGYPSQADAVFFGPDSYRFASFIRQQSPLLAAARSIFDIGAGSGVGAITACGLLSPERVVLTDVNPDALQLARANAAAAGIEAEFVQLASVAGVAGQADLILANPPFMAASGRTYSDGGAALGSEISFEWARAACQKLAPGGRLLLYTGSAIVDGVDHFRLRLAAWLDGQAFTMEYREIDPDIFGGELGKPAYAEVERIAAVGAAIVRIP
jgi:hypothetical protein